MWVSTVCCYVPLLPDLKNVSASALSSLSPMESKRRGKKKLDEKTRKDEAAVLKNKVMAFVISLPRWHCRFSVLHSQQVSKALSLLTTFALQQCQPAHSITLITQQ